MKLKKILKFSIIFFSAFFMCGCGNVEKTHVEEVIVADLDQLKDLDIPTIQQYISSKDLFPDAVDVDTDSENAQEFVSLFFENFDYKILDIKVKGNAATASLRLNTLDSQQLVKDYVSTQLKNNILATVDSDTSAGENTAASASAQSLDSLDANYKLLNQLIRDNNYKTVETNCTIELTQQDDLWKIQRTDSLENELVGEFISYITNPSLVTPDEILDVYLSTFKSMNDDQKIKYLNIADLLNTDDENTAAYSQAIVEQIRNCFDYEIADTSIDGYTATVNVQITTFDRDAILDAYNKVSEEYLKDPQALYDGAQGRQTKALDNMLQCIKDNTATTTSDVSVRMVNDGVSWVLEDSDVIANSIFGDFTTAITQSQDSGDYDSSDPSEVSDSSDSYDSSEEYDSSDSSGEEGYDSDSSEE